MSVTVDQLVRPQGRLKEAWIEDGDLLERLIAILNEPTLAGLTDAVVTHYAYWHAFEMLADDLMLEPATQAEGRVSSAYSGEQLAYWVRQAAHHERAYARLTRTNRRSRVVRAFPTY